MASYNGHYQKNKKTVQAFNLANYGEYTCEVCQKSPLYKGDGGHVDRMAQYNGVLLTIDHIVPLAKGGTNRLTNLQVCCSACNSRMGSK